MLTVSIFSVTIACSDLQQSAHLATALVDATAATATSTEPSQPRPDRRQEQTAYHRCGNVEHFAARVGVGFAATSARSK